ncbi:MAG: C-terminal binding protein [Firmicutes bacterium]|nr:C-terminal binding protein [Bacillota bacterium]
MKLIIYGADYVCAKQEDDFINAGIELLRSKDPDTIISWSKDSPVMLIYGYPVDKEFVDRLDPSFKCIITMFVGYDDIDIEACSKRGIMVCNNPLYGSEEVAALAITLMLDLNRKVYYFNKKLHEEVWESSAYSDHMPYPSRRLSCMTLGVVGIGNIGTYTAKMARGLGMDVIACDPYVPDEKFESLGIRRGTLDDVLMQSDAITLHVPLNEETYHMIDSEAISKMKDGVLFINDARGPVADEDALIEALKSGKIAAAGLDVFSPEPFPEDHIFRTMDNVILTPHTAWLTAESDADVDRLAAELAIMALKGEIPYSCINRKALGI